MDARPRRKAVLVMMRTVVLLALQPAVAFAQGIFGPPIGGGTGNACALSEYAQRSDDVTSVCCPHDPGCASGLPLNCDIDCAILFLDFYQDCQSLMAALLGTSGVGAMTAFNTKCLDVNDVPTLLNMIKSMTLQGCSADAAIDAQVATHNATAGFGVVDGSGHFSVEVGHCDFANLHQKITSVDQACCNPRDSGDACSNGAPNICDFECAIQYVPFYEDCSSVLHGSAAGASTSYVDLYQMCTANARRGASGVLRTMYLTNNAWNSAQCPVEAALDFFGDCPLEEPSCIGQFIGLQPGLAASHVHQFYRWQIVDNWGGANWCVYEIQLRGPNNCVHDTRQIASDMQRHYSDSSQGDGTSFSWRHYTDNCQSCSTGNTNSYGPDNAFDDPITNPPAGSQTCSDSGHQSGWVGINLTTPTMITGYNIRATSYTLAPKHIMFQGSDNMIDWIDIEERAIDKYPWTSNEQRMFWVGVPTGQTTAGIPRATFDSFNANPYAYNGLADIANICPRGAGAVSRDPYEGCVGCVIPPWGLVMHTGGGAGTSGH